MGRSFWLSAAAIGSGVGVLAMLIWTVAPVLEFAGYAPFESDLVRGALVACTALGGLSYLVYDGYSRRAASRELGDAVSQSEDPGDGDELKGRMKDALAKLKAAGGGRRDYLYDLPWYVIIGPPGSGKTTALVNSGLKFPLAGAQGPQSIAGVGGTRYCDWWFTDDAVLIDTAGRYTTQDSSQKADQKSWFSFLALLKKNRSKQPVNGVIVAISIADLVTLNEAELNAHADAVRSRLQELHEKLKINFPVYVLFTKFDLIAGFMEFFGTLDEMRRRMVWGATFQNPGKTENLVGRAPEEFDALVARLGEFLTDRLQAENDPTARLRVFGFPAQVATLKSPVIGFLNKVFEPTRFKSTATLRGFYFSSGTQEGTPIDRIIGSISKSFGAEVLGEGYLSGSGKSFFLNDLINKVIIRESAWVSTDRAAVRRSFAFRAVAYVALALVVAGGVAAWTTSYAVNDKLIDSTEEKVAGYRRDAQPTLDAREIRDRRFESVLPLLESIRNLPTGYGTRADPATTSEGFGLSQRPRLQSAAETSYHGALERMLRPRLLYRLEEVIGAARKSNDRAAVYEPFKVYLMLGAQGPLDKALVLDWARRDWAETLYAGPEREGMRRALGEHLVAMLDLDTGTDPTELLDGDLIRSVQQDLVQLSVAERAYQILRTSAKGEAPDWSLARAPVAMDPVFSTVDGSSLDAVRVSGFFTRDGFYRSLLDRLPTISVQLDRERWVLGEAGRQAIVGNQFTTLADDLLAVYARDFVAAWREALSKLRIKPLTADKPKYVTLASISAAASPLKQLFEEIRQQTDLSAPRKPPEGGAAGAAPAAPVLLSTSGSAARSIDAFFRPFYQMSDGQPRPVDQIVAALNDVYLGLVGASSDGTRSSQMTSSTRDSIRSLRANANRFPAPFDRMLRASSDELEGSVASTVVGDLQKSLAEMVTPVCRQLISGRYPFTKSDKEVQLADFARVFAPNGLIDRFFTQELASLVDTSKPIWGWRAESRVGTMLSPAAAKEFQRAADIKTAFFGAGGSQAGFAFSIQAMTATAAGTTVALDVNGVQVPSPQSAAPPPPPAESPSIFGRAQAQPPAPPPAPPKPAQMVSAQWPGPVGAGRAAVVATSDTTGTSFTLVEKTGPWALFRLVDQSKVAKQGAGLLVSVNATGREFRYQLNVGSLVNPFTMPALREFNCPASLQ